jgi:hypothetical protein
MEERGSPDGIAYHLAWSCLKQAQPSMSRQDAVIEGEFGEPAGSLPVEM